MNESPPLSCPLGQWRAPQGWDQSKAESALFSPFCSWFRSCSSTCPDSCPSSCPLLPILLKILLLQLFPILPPSPYSAPDPPPFPILLLLQLHLLLFLLILVLLPLLLRCCSLFLLKTLSRGNYCSDRNPVYEVIVGVAGPYELGVAEDLHRSIKSGHITIASVLPSVEEGHSTAGLGDQ